MEAATDNNRPPTTRPRIPSPIASTVVVARTA